MALWPIFGAAGGIYGAYKLIETSFCSVSDASAGYESLKAAYSAFLKEVQEAQAAGKIDSGLVARAHSFIDRMETIRKFKSEKIDATDPLTGGQAWQSTEACQFSKMNYDLHNDISDVSTRIAASMGRSPAVPKPPVQGNGSGWFGKLFWPIAIGVGGFLIYKYYFATDHGEYIPRERLPRYAGGTRRSS